MKNETARRRGLVALGTALGACALAVGISQGTRALGIHLNVSPSMPLGLYRFTPGTFPARRGELVYFCPPPEANAYMRHWHPDDAKDGECAGRLDSFIKIAAALPGDRIRIDDAGVHVNDATALPGSRVLHVAYDNDDHERWHHVTPQIAKPEWVVPQGEIWGYTPEWYSYDSRYYGPVAPIGTASRVAAYGDPPHSVPPYWQIALEKKAGK